MATEIKCPNCGHQFEPNESIREEIEKELRAKMGDWQKKKNEEFQAKLDDERKKIQQSLEENIRKTVPVILRTRSACWKPIIKTMKKN